MTDTDPAVRYLAATNPAVLDGGGVEERAAA